MSYLLLLFIKISYTKTNKMQNRLTLKGLILVFFILSEMSANAQRRSLINPQLFKISIDEDYLNYRGRGTDRYYTAGVEFGYYFKKSNFLFSQQKNDLSPLYFITLKQVMNTPNIIAKKGYQSGDYPYAGVLYGTYGSIHSSKYTNRRITKALSVGVLGPKAFAGETQIFAHGLIHYTKPLGWNSQIKGELMVNYMARYEKGLLAFTNKLDVISSTELNIGTVYTNASAGFTLRVGRLKSYFSNYDIINLGAENEVKKSLYFFSTPAITVVAFNGTLQGGLSDNQFFAKKNEYTVKDGNLKRLLTRLAFGVKYEGNKLSVSISQILQTAEFSTVQHHEYGNITISLHL